MTFAARIMLLCAVASSLASCATQKPSQTAYFKATVDQLGAMTSHAGVSMSDVTLSSETMPFLGGELKGKRTRLVRFDGVRIKDNSGAVNHSIRELEVLLVPDASTVLLVRSVWPSEFAPITPPPPAASEEEQWNASDIRFSGPPLSPAITTLTEALCAAHGGIAHAKEFIAYYTLLSEKNVGIDQLPVWVIQLRGLPVSVPHMPPGAAPHRLSDDALNHWTTIVNARTGESIMATSTPQPISSGSD